MLPFVFKPGMGFERYVDYALDVPLYFLKRGSAYIDVAGASFRDLLAGKLAAAPGERATLPIGRTICRRSFPKCGSSVTSRCAAPMSDRPTVSSPWLR